MELEETGVSMGTHSPNLAGPLIQMGQLLNPVEFTHQSRATDITVALGVLQSEVALLRAETIVLRVAVATQLDYLANVLNDHKRLTDENTMLVQAVQNFIASQQDRFKHFQSTLMETSRLQLETVMSNLQTQIMDVETNLTGLLITEIQAIPDTYFWPRLKRRVRKLLGFRDAV